ncbi:MAG: RidA family protein [Deltaproteobacteria bacterium]|nr:RidA family protein [Deltaproteobacteria bacterium]
MKKILAAFLPILVATGCLKTSHDREIISCPNAPAAIGPYSQAFRAGDTLYLSGQLGLDPATGKFAGQDFESQARQALENQEAILESAGFSLKDVVQCQVFLTDMDNYPDFNTIYEEYFAEEFPARAVLEVSRIPADGLIEIMMIAVRSIS